MPKIFDCFTYFDEDKILALRLETLDCVVDHFVIVEATHTFSGKPKALNFNLARFPKFSQKIIYVVVDDLPLQSDAWANEAHQRNAIMRGLKHAMPEDWIIVADVDEIPRPEAVLAYRPAKLFGSFIQRHYCYLINNLSIECDSSQSPASPRKWIRAKITTMRNLQNFFGCPEYLRIRPRTPGLKSALQRMRRHLGHLRLPEGGWHFAWMMSPEQMIAKIESYSHTEDNCPKIKSVEAIKTHIRAGRDILGKNEKFQLVEIDATFPLHVQRNPHLYCDWYLSRAETGHGADNEVLHA